jgi:two-component system nitrate/nitrite response regulator NarL
MDMAAGSKITRVVLADDHEKIRAGIRDILKTTSDIQVVGEASDGLEALHLVEDLVPDVLLLDMEMPLMNGSEVTARLQENASPVRILALSAYDDRQYVLSMLNTGASGYLTKDEVPETLINAVRGVAQGQQGWVSRRLAGKLSPVHRQVNSKKQDFSSEEKEILRMLGGKKSLHDIAETLGVSPNEIEARINGLQTKLDFDTRAELVLLAIDSSPEFGTC